MSEFEQLPPAPLPPPRAVPPVVSPAQHAPFAVPPQSGPYGPPPAPYGGQPYSGYPATGYPLVPGMLTKPPRPVVRGGSLLLIIGGAGLVLGSVLPWLTAGGQSLNGFSSESIDLDGGSNGGPAFAVLAVLLIGFGITQLAARKVLAVAIIAVVIASFALMGALAEMGNVSDAIDFAGYFGGDASWGAGVPVLGVSSLLGLGGAITTLATRRR
ncbi:MAG: hypothetical protein WCC60_16285 [Ilumatobacteraceae bacterium]